MGINYEVPHCVGFSTPNLIPLWTKYSPQDPVSNNLTLQSSLNVKPYVSSPYWTTGNIIVLYISIFKFLERSRVGKTIVFVLNNNIDLLF